MTGVDVAVGLVTLAAGVVVAGAGAFIYLLARAGIAEYRKTGRTSA